MKTLIKCCSCGRYITIEENESGQKEEKTNCKECKKEVNIDKCKQIMQDDWG